ncbi:MAG: type II secretion system protein GspL [Burkholderiaceae bacterium]|jgi:general secretion pathway protein L|nr:type II secretion system protein GspL [Burkholderiaceae bacterium]
MSFLVILLPRREHLRAGRGVPAEARGDELRYAVSDDGLTVRAHGRCAPALLPKADTAIAVVADEDVTLHRVTLPKAPPARLRAALGGLLEEALLDEPESTHFALAPGAAAGQPTWVATLHRPWLAAQLAALELAGVAIDRVVPAAWPDDPPAGHLRHADEGDAASPLVLTWADARGVATVRLQGGLARALLPQWQAQAARWSAAPSAAAAAERWLGATVHVVTDEERALQATRSAWNLRQFDLAPRHRGTLALRDAWKRVRSPAWRPARLGVAALAAVQIVGLNLWAWHQRGEIGQRQQAMVELLREAHPQVRAILDAPLQMERETAVLRAAAGRAGEGDLEALLQAAAQAWPEDRGPVDALRFDGASLGFAAAGWSDAQVDTLRRRLAPDAWRVEAADGRLTISRAAGGARL